MMEKQHGEAAKVSVTDGTTILYKVGADGTWSSTVPADQRCRKYTTVTVKGKQQQ